MAGSKKAKAKSPAKKKAKAKAKSKHCSHDKIASSGAFADNIPNIRKVRGKSSGKRRTT